jgi:hypothetical protein
LILRPHHLPKVNVGQPTHHHPLVHRLLLEGIFFDN